MNKIYLGKLVSTHGIKGELKLISDFEYKERVLKKDFIVHVDGKEYRITSCRPHKTYHLITLNNMFDINEVEYLVGKEVLINKEDLDLKANEYLLADLQGAKVYDHEEIIGEVTEILLGKQNNFVKVDNSFLIPLTDIFIEKYDKNSRILYTKNGKNLKL